MIQRVTATPLDASVIVPSHRGAHRLPALLDALSRQDHTGPWEVVVVLDGVLDDSPRILEQWSDRLTLRVLSHPQPLGVVAALNDGYSAARGRVLIRCDDDLTPGPDMIRHHLAHHAASGQEVGVIGPTQDIFPDSPYAVAYGRPATERSLRAAYARPADQRWVGWAAHNSVTRSAWDRVGGFDPRFVYGQDSELGFRLARAGVHLVVDPTLQLGHRGPALDTATRAPRAFVSGASRRLFNEVHGASDDPPVTHQDIRDLVWQAAVRTVSATVRSREGYARTGRLVDRALRHLPAPVGGRLVALVVESAGRSGRLHGRTDLSYYQSQKIAELSREVQP
jgi:glycosyltransferase involved in cell wall biosynthesis